MKDSLCQDHSIRLSAKGSVFDRAGLPSQAIRLFLLVIEEVGRKNNRTHKCINSFCARIGTKN